MKVETVCIVTLDDRDLERAASQCGIRVEHQVRPDRTIIRIGTWHPAQESAITNSASFPAKKCIGVVSSSSEIDDSDYVPWGASSRDPR